MTYDTQKLYVYVGLTQPIMKYLACHRVTVCTIVVETKNAIAYHLVSTYNIIEYSDTVDVMLFFCLLWTG